MDIYEMSSKFSVALAKLRRLEKEGYLKVTKASNPEWEKAKRQMKSGNRITVVQWFTYFREPSLIGELSGSHLVELERQQEMLGNLDMEDWRELSLALVSKASGPYHKAFPHLIELGEWVKETIPPEGCQHHYLAVRALWTCSLAGMPLMVGKLNRAFSMLRQQDEFKPWFTISTENGKNVVNYKRPDLEFDL